MALKAGGIQQGSAELSLADMLRRLRRGMREASLRTRIYGPDLDLALVDSLDVLAERRACRVGELAAELHVEISTATRTVDRLEARGLALRTPSSVDARAVDVTLTDAGVQVHRDISLRRQAILEPLLRDFDDGEKQLLIALLERVVEGVDQLTGTNGEVGTSDTNGAHTNGRNRDG